MITQSIQRKKTQHTRQGYMNNIKCKIAKFWSLEFVGPFRSNLSGKQSDIDRISQHTTGSSLQNHFKLGWKVIISMYLSNIRYFGILAPFLNEIAIFVMVHQYLIKIIVLQNENYLKIGSKIK